jgi:hypothetical protein
MKAKTLIALMGAISLAVALSLPAGAQSRPASPTPNRLGWSMRERATRPIAAPGRLSSTGSPRSTIECVTAPSEAGNVTLDCPREYSFPTHEASIAVDPADPDHIVTAAIDGVFGDQTIEFSTTFDGGRTWTIGDLPHGPNTQNFDPWVSFDSKRGTVLITFEYEGQGADLCVPVPEHTAQLVAISHDGGRHWDDPVHAFEGRGCFLVTEGTVLFGGEVKMATDNDPSSPHYGRVWLMGSLTVCRSCSGDSPAWLAEIHSDDG